MSRIRKILFSLLLLALIQFSLFASDSTSWWVGMPISDFEYTGLENVEQKDLDRLLSKYEGERFSDELFTEIYNTIYAQDYIEYISAESVLGGEDGESLIIRFNISENPMVSSVSVRGNERYAERTLINEQNYKKGSFISRNDLEINAGLIREYYLEHGYKDASVTYETTSDGESNTESITYIVDEGFQYKIRAINFTGISAFSDKDLRKILSSKQKSLFNSGNYIEANIETDKALIVQHYQSNGYINAAVNDVTLLDVTEDDGRTKYLEVVFDITEGEQYFFGSITFDGNEVYDDETIRNMISLEPGTVHDSLTLQSIFENLSSLYYNNGYIQAQIIPNTTLNEDNNTIDYNIQISEGVQSTIEEIRIEGLTKTKSYVFERELTIHVGEIFSRDKLIRSQQNIYNTGLVTNITVDLYQGSEEGKVIVVITVEEGNQMELQFGATFGGTVNGFPISGFLQWTDRNLAGTARNLSIGTNLSPTTQSLSLSFSDSWVGSKRWSNGISISASRNVYTNELQKGEGSPYFDGRDPNHESYPLGTGTNDPSSWWESSQSYPGSEYLMDYDIYRISLSYSTGYTFAFDKGNLTVSGGLSFGINRAVYDNKYDPYELIIKKYKDNWQWSNSLSLGLTWDGRDLIKNTTKGYVLSLSYTYAGGILGGLSNYNRLSLSAQGFVSLYSHLQEDGRQRNLVLALTSSVSAMFDQFWYRSEAGYWGFHGYEYGTRIAERLYIDGMNMARGFSPVTDLAFVWNNQVELSYPIAIDVLNAEAFISATAAVGELDELNRFTNLDWYFAAGIGIKLDIPGFPLGLYLVKDASWTNERGWTWEKGFIPGDMSIVLAITQSIY